ncbi:MAG: hypothetical protein C0501_10040 [Isosphaera sp.]|nr:hypothetical protein [Isosphaera sp.]
MTYAGTAEWLRPRLPFGFVLGAVAWAVWVGNLALGGWYKDNEGTLIGGDHLAFYTPARLIRDGEPGRMYDYDAALHAYQQRLIGWEWSGFEAYRNPPFYALLYVPTAGLSYYASLGVWTAVGLLALVAAVYLLRPARPGRVLLWAVAFYPVFATVSFGQNTLLSLLVFAAVYRLADAGRPVAAGLVAGLLWFKPPLLIGLFVWWGLAPRRHAGCLLGVGVTGLSLAAVSWAAVPDAARAFVASLGRNVGFGGEGMWNKHTPRAFADMLVPGVPAAGLAAWGVAAAAGVAVAWWVRRRTGGPVAVMFPVAVFLSLWASPHALIYEWALLVAAGVVLWERVPRSRDAWVCLFALAWVGLAVGTPLALVQIKYLALPAVVQVSVPVLGLVGWLAARELAAAGAGVGNPWPAGEAAGGRPSHPGG